MNIKNGNGSACPLAFEWVPSLHDVIVCLYLVTSKVIHGYIFYLLTAHKMALESACLKAFAELFSSQTKYFYM